MKTVITEKLEELKLNYTVKPHSQPVYTSEAAARERGVRLAQIVKTMLLLDSNDSMVVAVIPGDKKLDLKKIKNKIDWQKVFGQFSCTMGHIWQARKKKTWGEN